MMAINERDTSHDFQTLNNAWLKIKQREMNDSKEIDKMKNLKDQKSIGTVELYKSMFTPKYSIL